MIMNNPRSVPLRRHSVANHLSDIKQTPQPVSAPGAINNFHQALVLEKVAVTPEDQNFMKKSSSLVNAPVKKSQQRHLIRTKLEKTDFDDDAGRENVKVIKSQSQIFSVSNKAVESAAKTDVKKDTAQYNGSALKLNGHEGKDHSTATVKVAKGIEMKRTNKIVSSSSTPSLAGLGARSRPDPKPSRNLQPTTTAKAKSKPSRAVGMNGQATTLSTERVQNLSVSESREINEATGHQPDTVHLLADSIEPESSRPKFSNSTSTSATNLTNVQPTNENASTEKPKYFKSSFWNYVDTKKKPESRIPKPEKPKTHDQPEIQKFMDKRKEIRLLKEKREAEEKQKASEKKKQQLEQLNDKCREIVASSKPQASKSSLAGAFVATTNQPMKQYRNKQSLSPMKAKRFGEGNLNSGLQAGQALSPRVAEPKSEIDLRARTLLQQFENMVQQECMNVLREKKSNNSQDPQNNTFKVDVAVETTMSLFNTEFDQISNCSVASNNIIGADVIFQEDEGMLAKKHRAAAQIQAAYKGYRIRRALAIANRLPSYCCRRVSRRISSHRPLPPVGLSQNTKISTGAIERNTWDNAYIPPPSFISDSPKSKCLPSPRSGGNQLSRFEEPFPKDALRRLSAIHDSPKPKSFYERRHSDSSFKLPPNLYRRRKNSVDVDEIDSPRPRSRRYMDEIDLPVPTFSTVLKEKVRLYEEKTTNMIKSQERKSPSKLKRAYAEKPESGDVYDSDSTEHASVILDLENTITEEYIGPDEKKMREAYVLRTSPRSLDPTSLRRSSKNFHRKKLALSFSPQLRSGSTTTVETDIELKSNTSQGQDSQFENEILEKLKQETNQPESKETVPSSTFGIEKYPKPCLQLQFQAEKERLHILDQALKTFTTEAQIGDALQRTSIPLEPQEDRTGLKNSQDYIVEIAKCQADCLKATAEVTKWMSDLRKSEKEREFIQRDQQTVNMAAVVFAAVEEAKRMSSHYSKNTFQTTDKIPTRAECHIDESTQYPSESEVSIKKWSHTDKKSVSLQTSIAVENEENNQAHEVDSVHEKEPALPLESLSQSSDKNVQVEDYEPTISFYSSSSSSSSIKFPRPLELEESKNEVPEVEFPEPEKLFVPNAYENKEVHMEGDKVDKRSESFETENDAHEVEEEYEKTFQATPHLAENGNLTSNVFQEIQTFPREDLDKSRDLNLVNMSTSQEDELVISEILDSEQDDEEKKVGDVHQVVRIQDAQDRISAVDLAIPASFKDCEDKIEASENLAISSEDSSENPLNDPDYLKPKSDSNEEPPIIDSYGNICATESQVESLSSVHPLVTERSKTIVEDSHLIHTDEGFNKIHDFNFNSLEETSFEDVHSDKQQAEEFQLPDAGATTSITEIPPPLYSPPSPSYIENSKMPQERFEEHEFQQADLNYDVITPAKPEDFPIVETESPKSPIVEFPQDNINSPTEDRKFKPPPPYSYLPPDFSPPSPLSSSFIIDKPPKNTCKESQICEMIKEHIDYVWEYWCNSKSLPSGYSTFSTKMINEEDEVDDEENVFELLISDVIRECIQDTLRAPTYQMKKELNLTSIETIYPAPPVYVKAQEFRLPQTKERLFQCVYDNVMDCIPPGIVIYAPGRTAKPEKKFTKWVSSSRFRDLADEVLGLELVKQERDWLDCWPEEVKVTQRLSENILRRLVSEVVSNFQVALH